MAQLKLKKQKNNFIIESFKDIRKNIREYFFRAKLLIILMFFSSLFSPVAFFFVLFILTYLFNVKIWNKYFKNKVAMNYYISEFSCPPADNGVNVFTKFGYSVDVEDDQEWDNHKARLGGWTLPDDINDFDKETLAQISESLAKEANRVKRTQKHREFGIGRDMATRHLLFIGSTGSGKTETLMSIYADVLDVKNSGGIIFIDGKADAKMHSKLSSLISQKNRVTSQYTINFLKQEKMSTTNTYNSITTMSPYKGVSFMASLLPSGGEGNADYFKNRGIAMLTIPLSALRIRNEFYGEPFSLSLLQNSTSPLNISVLYCLFYGFVKEENERIKHLIETNRKVSQIWREAKDKSTSINQDMEYYEKILNYVTQYKPSAKADVEEFLGYEFRLFFMSYNMVFKTARMYMNEVFVEWKDMTNIVADVLYSFAREEKQKSFSVIHANYVGLDDIRRWFDEINSEEGLERALQHYRGTQKDINLLKTALGMIENAKATLHKLPETAMQQHAYAMQQWTSLFQTFEKFPHVFGSPFPDVAMKDIMKNNKCLYTLIPVLELGEEMSKLLGKMVIRDMQEAGSFALGGEKLNITPRQRAIYEDKITPKPLSIMTADEYGYYRVEGGVMSAILAQFRSLNMGAILSLQDVAGLGNEEETKKTLANTSKFVLKSYDTEIREFVEKQLGEVESIEMSKYIDADGKVVDGVGESITVSKDKSFDVSILGDMSYGCGIYICNSKPRIVQSYYFGGDEVEPYVVSMERYNLSK